MEEGNQVLIWEIVESHEIISAQQKKMEDLERENERLEKCQNNRNVCAANGPTVQPNENVVFEQSANQNLPIQRDDSSCDFHLEQQEVCCISEKYFQNSFVFSPRFL